MTHINQRRDTAANWASFNPVLNLGEIGWERDTRKSKLGDGITAWNSLAYATQPFDNPVFTGNPTAPTASPGDNDTSVATTAFVAALGALKANIASPTFTGTPAAPTPANTDNSTKIATTAFALPRSVQVVTGSDVDTLSNTGFYGGGSLTNTPSGTDGRIYVVGDGAYAAQIYVSGAGSPRMWFRNRIASVWGTWVEASKVDSPSLTGDPQSPTRAPGNNSNSIATTAFVAAVGALKANIASPTFTGTPAAPTAAAGTNTTQVATTAFVTGGAYQTVTYQAGYTAAGFGYVPGARVNGTGEIICRGVIAKTTGNIPASTTIATLPSGCWPSQTVYANLPSTASQFIPVQINTNGDIVTKASFVAANNTGVYVSLDGLSFSQ